MQSSSDSLADHNNIYVAIDQPDAYNTAPASKMGMKTQPQETPASPGSQGSNPFENKKTDRDDMEDDEGDFTPPNNLSKVLPCK